MHPLSDGIFGRSGVPTRTGPITNKGCGTAYEVVRVEYVVRVFYLDMERTLIKLRLPAMLLDIPFQINQYCSWTGVHLVQNPTLDRPFTI